MKKKQIFLKTIVAITLLSAMLVSAFLGTSNAEYFKSFNKTLSLEMKPDLNLSYYLKDATDITSENANFSYNPRFGTYKNSNSFSQTIKVGRDASTLTSTASGIYKSATWDGNVNSKYNGKNIIYQIRIPVDETGYYSLDFAVDFTMGQNGQTADVFTQNYDRAIGCEILTHKDLSDGGFSFGGNKRLDLYERSGNDAIYVTSNNTTTAEAAKQGVKRFSDLVGHRYQWKTLAPTRQEYVSLAFKVEADDVKNGYVLWMWDFEGLYGSHSYLLEFTDVSVEKIMNLDGTTDTRLSNTPYFMFPETSQVNNQLVRSIGTGTEASYPTSYSHDKFTYDTKEGYTVRGMNDRGKVSYSKGRGAFVTEATTNSLQLQAESIAYGYSDNLGHVAYSNDSGTFANPLAFYVPVKNVKPGVTYKVTFDLSIARQGTYQYSGYTSAGTTSEFDRNKMTNATLADYATYSNMFKDGTNVFSSYLFGTGFMNGSTPHPTNRSTNDHQKFGMMSVMYNNKAYNSIEGDYIPLTKYDEFTKYSNLNYSTNTSINDTYSYYSRVDNLEDANNLIYRTETRNWFNAMRHTEYNGQNAINWLTFYNTTFSFNIDSASSNGLTIDPNTGYITNLEWAWVIDSVIPMSYYRIRLDNVRIQEVVEYTSSLNDNGVKFGDTQVSIEMVNHDDYGTKNGKVEPANKWAYDLTANEQKIKDSSFDCGYRISSIYESDVENKGVFSSLRGINGTGQNYQARGFVKDYSGKNTLKGAEKVNKTSQRFMAESNIYAPIVDASKYVAASGTNDYKIFLSGFAVCEGGVDRYVFSVDGGNTWYDMTYTEKEATDTQLKDAAKGVNQHMSGTTRYAGKPDFDTYYEGTRVTYDKCTIIENENGELKFPTTAAKNANFDGFGLYADLSAFKHQANLDIIIAAVPESNHDLRCEILRIVNYNRIRNYRTYADIIVSDITVTSNGVTSELSAVYGANGEYDSENKDAFTIGKGVRPTADNNSISAGGGYALRFSNSYDYEDIRTLYSDIPVKTKLKVLGYALVEGDVESYWWSVDGGKNWNPCPEAAVDATLDRDKNSIRDQRLYWYDGVSSFDASISSHFEPAYDSATHTHSGGISADLSAYEGEVVDVIFCAKPKTSDVYVPIARIDNVAVYGEQGTFYTRVHRVIIDGRTNEDPKGIQKAELTQKSEDSSGAGLNFVNTKWDLSYVENGTKKYPISNQSYVIFEPQNVNAANARYLFNDVKEIESGGRVAIDGYVMCKGGVSRYKFSLDGGETWTVINDTGTNMSALASDHSMITNSKYSDSSFNANPDGNNGNFCCTTETTAKNPNDSNGENRKAFYDRCLEFNIPALPEGTERDLLVVAENDPDGDPNTDDGKEFPVLHMKIKVKNTKFGYQNITRNADLSKLNVQAGYKESNPTLTFNPEITNRTGGVHNTLNRITIPVTETGEHTLSFAHSIYNGPSTYSVTNRQLYNPNGTENKSGSTKTKANITLTANKTHYLVGEQIDIDLAITKTTDAGFGTFKAIIVSEDWVNNYDNQHAICASADKTLDWDSANTSGTWSADDIMNVTGNSTDAFGGHNAGLQSDVINMGAGKYKIMIIHKAKDLLVNTEGSDEPVALSAHDFLRMNGLRERFLIAEIPIYIHDADEKVDFSLVHDEGEYTYFSDVSRQLVAGDDNVADTETLTAAQVFGIQTNSLSLDIDVTEGDVRRGYIILDTNYTGLWAGNEHTEAQCETKYGTNWGTPENSSTSHVHADDTCLSRKDGNGSTFYKQVNGDTLYILDKKFTDQSIAVSNYTSGTHYVTDMDKDTDNEVIHTGIDYTVTFNLGANALSRKT